ncbi:MAG: UDP-3-O-(3-hydroxymyristoyl)glucosamine N-acyltransferase, partial [Pseudomonadota bacterium]|nr:UDP-3-O-(3-hydroxymyristoyl)glucosamine N-acyltransferase [Pseudomonadota bacterium]
MSSNFFLKKTKKINNLFNNIKFRRNFTVNSIKTLQNSRRNDLTFFDSIKYKDFAISTKASACITSAKLEKYLPSEVQKIIVKNVLFELSKVLKKIYPYADVDYPDSSLKKSQKSKHKSVKFGNNVLVGQNVKIGQNSLIGSNTIIEKNVIIGRDCVIGSGVILKNSIIGDRVVLQDNCKMGQKGFGFIPLKNKNLKFPHIGKVIIENDVEIASGCTIDRGSVNNTIIGKNCVVGSNVVLKNSILGNNVVIQDGCKIGTKGFGFIPLKDENLKFPHIGRVLISDNVEIASNCTIDRGSVDDTSIGKNTYLDNQVHIAHNVKIGSNCMIAGQVGFAGSSTIGNNVSIGGQAGISGHLKIGNNVKIGGGSGVVKDIEDNQIVMGYPAVPLKEFLKS